MTEFWVEVTKTYRVLVENEDSGDALVAAVTDASGEHKAHKIDARVLSEVSDDG